MIRANSNLIPYISFHKVLIDSTTARSSSSVIESFWSKGVRKPDTKLIVCLPCSVCCCSTAPNSSLLASLMIRSGHVCLKRCISVICSIENSLNLSRILFLGFGCSLFRFDVRSITIVPLLLFIEAATSEAF